MSSNRAQRKRSVKRTQKAQELLDAGEHVPGLGMPDQATEPPKVRPALTQTAPQKTAKVTPASRLAQTRAPPAAGTPLSSVPRRLQQATQVNNPKMDSMTIPLFNPDTLRIYPWQPPYPTRFTALSDDRKNEKYKMDDAGKWEDINDGADEWSEFCGDRSCYPANDHRGGSAMEYCIASTFVHRAKRAYWSGKSWEEFEFDERTIDSEEQARTEADGDKRAVCLATALDNRLRIAVFEGLKGRLCSEIWLKEHPGLPSVVRTKVECWDSREPTPTLQVPRLTDEEARAAPTTVERGRGIVFWSIDATGLRQPVYEDERKRPSGMVTFMDEMRELAEKEAAPSAPAFMLGRLDGVGPKTPLPMPEAQVDGLQKVDVSDSDAEGS
ncbi:hypothetical protein BDY17DRAFT_327554 [Neohortaea acidophila]|uniref:Uncharacterized protein n=1 Tax=Neohortaea acidophila TaxID=245834 RepID=A0A6A6PIR9_9PEZI|nr:uncharacterized protein BDY17DRAFT_327554 [Neohortaea acidophila]KAF2479601.1 hypothetical protein BDY17DRAFT_327554 [Neohortaea acidophila]